MKLITLLLLCCVAKDINSATITIGNYLSAAQQQINAAVEAQKKAAAAAGATSNVKAPTVPTVTNPNQVIVNPPKIPLPSPKCDFNGLSALLKALFGRVKGSCSGVKKSRGPLKPQCEAAKANFTTEFNNALPNVTSQISYAFPNCSAVVDPAIKGFTSCAGKVFDALTKASTDGEDKKTCGKNIDISIKELTIALKTLLESMNSVVGNSKPAAGTNEADALATSDLLLSTILQTLKVLLDMTISVSGESSVEIGGITKTLSDACDAINKKVEGGSKIAGSVSVEFCITLTITIKSVSSVDLDAFTEECGKIETDCGKATDSASDVKGADDEDDEGTESPGGETSAPGGETSAPGGETSAPGGETSAPGGETSAPGSGTSAPGNDTSAPGNNTSAPGNNTSAPGNGTSAPETPEEKPTAADCVTNISTTINVSFQSITKTCGALKTDVPSMGGQVDTSLTSVSSSLNAILTLVKTSDTASVTQVSTQMDAAITALVKSLTDFLTTLTTLIESLKSDTSVAVTTAVKALELIQKTILSISCKVITSISVLFEKLDLFTTVTLDATFTAIGKIDVNTADCKTVATDLTAVTAPTELNADSCKKVVEGLGKSTTDACGKMKTNFSASFELRISFIFNAYGYTLQKVKAPKVTTGITNVQESFSALIKEIETACSCAKDSKAKSGDGGSSDESSSGEGSGEKTKSGEGSGEKTESGEGSGEKTKSEEGSGEKTKSGEGGAEKSQSGEGSGEISKCKPVSPDSFKSVFEALLALLDASKTQAADKTMDPEALEIFNLTLKELFVSITAIFTGLSATLTEQSIDVSVLLSLGTEILTKATGGAEIDYETLTPTVDGVLCYGNAVDAATPAVDSVKKCEAKISEPATEGGETSDTKPSLSELSTSASSALTICSKSISSFTKYYTKPVDGVGTAITKISSIIAKFIKDATTVTDVTTILEEFLVQISLAIEELTATYTDCSASTKTDLDPKGYNAKSGLKFILKQTTTIINSIFISIKVYIVDVPADLTEFWTGVSDAVKDDCGNPDSEPSELGDKVKASCDKHNAKGGSGEDKSGGSGEDKSGGSGEEKSGDKSGEDGKSGETKTGEDKTGEEA